jgi:pyrroloquinoline quinone biosynthesis protein B
VRGDDSGNGVALWFRDEDSGRTLFYAPGLAALDDGLRAVMAESDCVMVDGTFWRDDEMAHAGCGTKTAAAMGHVPVGGPRGMLAFLRGLPTPRKILIHINNTNPILDESSPEHAEVLAAGVEIAADGLQILL